MIDPIVTRIQPCVVEIRVSIVLRALWGLLRAGTRTLVVEYRPEDGALLVRPKPRS